MIRLALCRKQFGGQLVLGEIALVLQPGERLAILGPSGIGKSTLLRILAGIDRDFDGQLKSPRRVAMVFQEPTLLPWRSVADNLRLTTDASPVSIADVLDAVGLSAHAAKFPGQLSLGQQRRVALARALTAEPEVLLLDEPFASLDDALAAEMRELVVRLLSDSAMGLVLVTHARADADAICPRAVRLIGSPARLASVD